MNYDCFQCLFFRQLLQEVYSLRKSPFIVIHISGDFDQTILQTQLPSKQASDFFLELCCPELITLQGRRNRPGLIGLLYAPSTLLLWNLKRKVYSDNPSNVFRRNYVGEIQKRKNNRPFWISVRKKSVREITRLSPCHRFRKAAHENENPAFVNSSGLRRVFENVHFRYSVDGRPDPRNKVAFPNISDVVRTLPIIVWKRSTRCMCFNRGHEMYGLNDRVRWKTMKSEQWNVLGHLRKQKGKRWRQ